MRSIQRLSSLAMRGISTSARKAATNVETAPKGVIPASKGYEKVRKIQKLASENPDVLVWRLFGMRDTILYNFTLFVMTLSAVTLLKPMWRFTFPQKK